MIKSKYVRLLIYSYLGSHEIFTKISKLTSTEREALVNSHLMTEDKKARPLKLFVSNKHADVFAREIDTSIKYLISICSSLEI